MLGRPLGGEHGGSLVAVLVAVGIGGMLALGISAIATNGFRAQSSVERRSDREAVKNFLIARVSCRGTSASCTPGQPVELRTENANGVSSVLVGIGGQKFGDVGVRAECSPSGTGTIVRSARLLKGTAISAGKFAPDPLTGKVVTFSDPESLVLPDGIEMCSGAGLDRYPDEIICEIRSGPSRTSYRLWHYANYGSSAFPMYNLVSGYQGISSSWPERVTYRQASGAAVGITPVSGSYVGFTAAKHSWGAHCMRCPIALHLDGRRRQSVFEPPPAGMTQPTCP